MKRKANIRDNGKFINLATTLGSMLIVLALTFALLSIANIKVASANSTSSNVVANVVVQTYCQISGSNTFIVFPGEPPGTGVATANLVLANTVGNAASNILVSGGIWILNTGNTIPVANVLWNPTTSGSPVGNGLTTNPVNTFIALPITAGSASYNNIFFGLNAVPGGSAPGLYTNTIVLQNSCSGTSNTFSVALTINVLGACYISISNSAIGFGTINPGANTPFTSNLVVDNAIGSNVNTNVVVEGSNWASGVNNFAVSNTLWSNTNAIFGSAGTTPLTLSLNLPGTIVIPWPPVNNANNIYFGVSVPPGEPAGTYTQNILMENLC